MYSAFHRFWGYILNSERLIVLLRAAIAAGTWLRVFLAFLSGDSGLLPWLAVLIPFTLHTLVSAIAVLHRRNLDEQWFARQVVVDIVLISLMYWLSGDPYSDVFLYYFLPILIIADNLKRRQALILLVAIVFAFVTVFLFMYASASSAPLTLPLAIWRDLVPRVVFFGFVLLIAFVRQSRLVRLAQDLTKQSEAMKVLNEAGTRMNATLDMGETRTAIVKYAFKLAKLDSTEEPSFSYLVQLARDGRTLKVVAAHPSRYIEPLQLVAEHIDIRQILSGNNEKIGIVGTVFESGESKYVQDVSENAEYIPSLPDSTTKSQLSVPIKNRRSETIAVLSIEYEHTSAVTTAVQENMKVLAVQSAAAIENATLYSEITLQGVQARRLLNLTHEHFRAVDVQVDQHGTGRTPQDDPGLAKVGEQILRVLSDVTPCDRATLQLISGGNRFVLARHGRFNRPDDPDLHRLISEDRLAQRILEARSVLVLSPPESDPDWERKPPTSDIKSWIGIPLVYGEQHIGLITLDQVTVGFYTPEMTEEIEFLHLFSQHITSILKNAVLLQQNAERLERLTEAKDLLEDALEFFDSYHRLALIGLVYGESIHWANNKLGMAKLLAESIAQGKLTSQEEIENSARRIVGYIRSFLELLSETQNAALREQPHERKNIHDILKEVVDSKRKSSHINIVFSFEAIQPYVFAPVQLKQVFRVVVDNALKAMHGEGTLTISTRSVIRDALGFIQVDISDTGSGIPEHLQKDLFILKPRHTQERRRGGTGTGLPWVDSFLRIYRGSIDFTTASGVGTTMHVLVPEDFRNVMPVPLDPDEARDLLSKLKYITSGRTSEKEA